MVESDCRFSGRWCGSEIADLVGGVGERDCRFSGREWGRKSVDFSRRWCGREIADLAGGSGGERLQI